MAAAAPRGRAGSRRPALGLPAPLERARDRLRGELGAATRARLDLSLRNPGTMPAGYAEDATPGSALGLRGGAHETPALAAQFGLRLERAGGDAADDDAVAARLEGSALATEALGLQWQAWSRRSWWGPGWQDSLVLGHNAPAIAGFGVQRAAVMPSATPWLAWLGPWSFEFFVGALEGVETPRRPFLVGSRLSLRPLDGLEIGLTRTAQWGGHGRPQSARSFLEMLSDVGLNRDDPEDRADDAANALAGVDLRLRCPGSLRCAVYLQGIGEDEAGGLPSRWLGLYGLEAWSADGRWRWFAEMLESGCGMPVGQDADGPCAYRNHAYPGGYVQDGRWLGASFGPDSRILTLGALDAQTGMRMRLHYGTLGARVGAFVAQSEQRRYRGRLFGLQASTQARWRRIDITPEVGWMRVHAAGRPYREARLGLSFSVALDELFRQPGTSPAAARLR